MENQFYPKLFALEWQDNHYPNSNWQLEKDCYDKIIIYYNVEDAIHRADKLSYRQNVRIVEYTANTVTIR